MKKLLLSIGLIFFAFSAFAQDTIPNGDFEKWITATDSLPTGYLYSSATQNFFEAQPINVVPTKDAYHGKYALELFTSVLNGDTSFAYIANSNPQNGNPATWHGGNPISQLPSAIRGYYKYTRTTSDSGTIILAFSLNGSNIGTYMFHLGPVSSYTEFEFPLTPTLAQTPDSFVFAAASTLVTGGQPKGIAGDTLKLDSISLKGLTAQPTGFNGDFENWTATDLVAPYIWNANVSGGSISGVTMTTDAVHGKYAAELTTFLGNENNHAAAQSGQLMLGYYPKNCNGNCYQQGGIPFTNMIDTLAFFYKYIPVNNDSANISLNFTVNNSNIYYSGATLHKATNYAYMEIPFSLPSTPDSVIISIQSSFWNDTTVNFVGSDLKIDRLVFKSQVIKKSNPVITWATPSEITVGTALSSTQLDASSTLLGNLMYADTSGQILPAGKDTLWVTFIPLDKIDYNKDSASVVLVVKESTLVPSTTGNGLSIYPNPARGQVTISSPDVISSIRITDLEGKVILELNQTGQNLVSVPLTGLQPGEYILSVGNGNQIVQEKLLVH